MRRFILLGLVLMIMVGVFEKRSWMLSVADVEINGPRTVEQRITQYGPAVALRLQPDFDQAGVTYPPTEVTLVVLKQERKVEVYAKNRDQAGATGGYRYIRSYPILAASGNLGPKLQEGDEQVPEGIYAVESLNPNSHYHLALHVGYPNAFDRQQAQVDGRTQLGGEIMIHGSDVSIGCVAMGDTTSEDLFVLTALTGIPRVHLLFCPFDFRLGKKMPEGTRLPVWSGKLYADLEQQLRLLPGPPSR